MLLSIACLKFLGLILGSFFVLVTVTFLEIEWMCEKVVGDAEKMKAVLLGLSWLLFFGFLFFFK